MPGLEEIQSGVAEALLDRSLSTPDAVRGARHRNADRRFGVYRNNVSVGLVSALVKQFPAIHRLVGDEFFRAMAREYALREPPTSPVLLHYGATFPMFIDGFAPAAQAPYLGDVARLEFACSRAYHAADVLPVNPQTFASWPAERLGEMRVRMHPSVAVIASRHPIVSIWRNNQDTGAVAPVQPWGPESALVARAYLDVEVTRIPPGGYAFLASLTKGLTLVEAAEAGRAAAADFDLDANIAMLVAGNIVVSVSGRDA